MFQKRKIEPRKNCIICEKEIYRSSGQPKYREKRKPADVTCSRACSKIYGRVSMHIYQKFYRGNKKKEKN